MIIGMGKDFLSLSNLLNGVQVVPFKVAAYNGKTK